MGYRIWWLLLTYFPPKVLRCNWDVSKKPSREKVCGSEESFVKKDAKSKLAARKWWDGRLMIKWWIQWSVSYWNKRLIAHGLACMALSITSHALVIFLIWTFTSLPSGLGVHIRQIIWVHDATITYAFERDWAKDHEDAVKSPTVGNNYAIEIYW